MISIRYPIWKTRSVGIAEYKIGTKETTIEILYKDKLGRRLYPHIYRIASVDIRRYPIEVIHGINLRIVPIADLDIISDVPEPQSSLSAVA